MSDPFNIAAGGAARLARMKHRILLAAALALAACSKSDDAGNAAAPLALTNAPAAAGNAALPENAAAPAAAPAVAGFDPARAPLVTGSLGAWPYFGLLDGYARATNETIERADARKWLEDVKYERFEFFDGTKLIPVEGRAFVTRGLGREASFFQIQKNYEKLIHDLGGVTVFEGTGEKMAEAKLAFADQRYRGEHFLKYDRMGVYMARFADRQLWIEVYQPWDDEKGYWLTIMETKPLEVTVKAITADQMKSALDAQGHIALYLNFDTDRTVIRPESQPTVAQIVALLNANPDLKLTVEGHTDNVGSPTHNQALSQGRANAVVGALMAQGIDLGRLSPKGLGQIKPIADNATEAGRAKNRRVELVKRS